jgi:hypothetical protein
VPTLGLASLGLTYGEMLAVESRATTHASMISNSVGRNLMPGINAKETFSPLNRKIVIYPMRQLVKKHVAIRAKAKDVSEISGPLWGRPSGLRWQISAYAPAIVMSHVPQIWQVKSCNRFTHSPTAVLRTILAIAN